MGALHRGPQGELGAVVVDRDGRGNVVGEIQWGVGEMVGRGVVVERVENNEGANDDVRVENEKVRQEQSGGEGGNTVVGVVARSAGAWENSKVVCACSGKTVWEEREEMVSKGII